MGLDLDDERLLPWRRLELLDWDIVGMNHYWVNGTRFLFVAMTKEGRCVRAEGSDEADVFEALATLAHSPHDHLCPGCGEKPRGPNPIGLCAVCCEEAGW
jgi:hypothetical protein